MVGYGPLLLSAVHPSPQCDTPERSGPEENPGVYIVATYIAYDNLIVFYPKGGNNRDAVSVVVIVVVVFAPPSLSPFTPSLML